jgi:hypothetical protein
MTKEAPPDGPIGIRVGRGGEPIRARGIYGDVETLVELQEGHGGFDAADVQHRPHEKRGKYGGVYIGDLQIGPFPEEVAPTELAFEPESSRRRKGRATAFFPVELTEKLFRKRP